MRSLIISRVLLKLAVSTEILRSNGYPKETEQAKFKNLSPQSAIGYAKLWEEYYGFTIPEFPKTEKFEEDGTPVIRVEVQGISDVEQWFPVWFDPDVNHLFGEY